MKYINSTHAHYIFFLILHTCTLHPVTWIPLTGPSVSGQQGTTPQMVTAPNGDLVVIWENITAQAVQTTSLSTGSTSWSAPTTVTSGADFLEPWIDFYSNGDAVAGWRNVTLNNVQTSIYSALTSTWAPAFDVSPVGPQSAAIQVAAYTNGDAIAVWKNNGADRIQTSTYSALSSSWSAPFNLSPTTSVRTPNLGVDASDNTIVTWNRTTPGSFSIQATQLPAGSLVWSAATPISDTPIQNVIPSVLSVYDNGNAISIWSNIITGTVQSNIYSSGTQTWGVSPLAVSPSGQNTTNPQIQMAIYNPTGTAVAIWESTTPSEIQTSFYSPGTNTWSTPVSLGTAGSDIGFPQVAFDDNGNVLAVWVDNSIPALKAATLWAGSSTWIPTSQDIPLTGTLSTAPQVSFNAQGEAVVVWTEDIAGTLEVNSVVSQNLFPPEPVQNITTIAGQKVFATQTECFNRITWQANPLGAAPTSYQIYRNGILIATVPATTFSYESHNLPCGTSYTYEVAAIID